MPSFLHLMVLVAAWAVVTSQATLRGASPLLERDCLPCHIAHPQVLWAAATESSPLLQQQQDTLASTFSAPRCLTSGPGYQASYPLPRWLVEEIFAATQVEVCLAGAYVKDGRIVMLQNDTGRSSMIGVTTTNEEKGLTEAPPPPSTRRLFQADPSVRFGEQKLLAVHVLTATETPDVSLPNMQMAVFGTGNGTLRSDAVPLVKQFEAISKGQLLYTAATGPNIVDGMLQVTLPPTEFSAVEGRDIIEEVIPTLLATTNSAVGGNLDKIADRVLFCLPSESTKGGYHWRAFTYLYGPYSYYQRATCSLLSVLAHELGHGLGFQHSAKGTDKYGDQTGLMGGWQGPKMAFNGHKHFISGWFSVAAKKVYPQHQKNTYMRLLGFVDYNLNGAALPADDVVILRAGDLHLQYNQAKGYNADVKEPNTVTITHAASDEGLSDALVAISPGETYTYPNFDDSGNYLIVEVCLMFERHALINLYLSPNGRPRWACVTSPPSSAPSGSPSCAPSSSPSLSLAPTSSTMAPSTSTLPCGEPANPTSQPAGRPTDDNDGDRGILSRLVTLFHQDPWFAGGVALAVILVTILACLCCRRRRRASEKPSLKS